MYMDHIGNLRDYSALKNEKFNEERVSTPTSTEQVQLLFYFAPNTTNISVLIPIRQRFPTDQNRATG